MNIKELKALEIYYHITCSGTADLYSLDYIDATGIYGYRFCKKSTTGKIISYIYHMSFKQLEDIVILRKDLAGLILDQWTDQYEQATNNG